VGLVGVAKAFWEGWQVEERERIVKYCWSSWSFLGRLTRRSKRGKETKNRKSGSPSPIILLNLWSLSMAGPQLTAIAPIGLIDSSNLVGSKAWQLQNKKMVKKKCRKSRELDQNRVCWKRSGLPSPLSSLQRQSLLQQEREEHSNPYPAFIHLVPLPSLALSFVGLHYR